MNEFRPTFESQKEKLLEIWEENGKQYEVMRQLFLRSLVEIAWRNVA